jgi:hypothetical protein
MPEKKQEGHSYYFDYFKNIYDSWEKSMSQALEMWLRSPLFTTNAERATQKAEEFKNYVCEIMERAIKTRYYPVKSDMDQILKSLGNIEGKLSSLYEKISAFEAKREVAEPPQKPKTKPKRSKKQ